MNQSTATATDPEQTDEIATGQRPEQQQETPATPETVPSNIQNETHSEIDGLLSGDYQKKAMAIDQIHELKPSDAVSLISQIENPDRDKGLIARIAFKMTGGITGEQLKQVFDKVKTAEYQIAFAKKLDSAKLGEHIVDILGKAASDAVRTEVIKKMREQFKSDEEFINSFKTAGDKELAKELLNRVPQSGIEDSTIQAITEKDHGLGVNMKARSKSQERFKKSGPESVADTILGPFARIGSFFKGLFSKIGSFFGFGGSDSTATPSKPS